MSEYKDPFALSWPVAAKGYTWLNAEEACLYSRWEDDPHADPAELMGLYLSRTDRDQRGPYLVPRSAAEYHYNPMESSDLHRQFAALDSTMASFAEFAGRHGPLTKGDRLESMDHRGGMGVLWGDHIDRWVDGVFKVRLILEAWDLARFKRR